MLPDLVGHVFNGTDFRRGDVESCSHFPQRILDVSLVPQLADHEILLQMASVSLNFKNYEAYMSKAFNESSLR